MKYPKITIVTPSFNQAQYIEQTIDSVLSQNYPNLEYIVVDGNSTDNSASLIKKYEKHLSFWVSEPDRGQSHAINKGLKIATGEIFNWLNSDDYLEAGSLKIIADVFRHPSVNMISGRSNVVENGNVVNVTSGTDIYGNNLPKTLGWARIDQPETYFRKQIFDKLGSLDESLHYVMDKEFWMRYLIHFGLNGTLKIPHVLANFRRHSNSKTQQHSEAFEIETNNLMYQLAVTNNKDQKANVIKAQLAMTLVDTKSTRATFVSTPSLIDQALDYFLLNKADNAYYNNKHDLCLRMLSKVDIKSFELSDQNLYTMLKFKSRYLPVWIKNIVRRWL